MSCGCVAQGYRTDTKEPVCVTHDCDEVVKEIPSLEGRKARCAYCQTVVDSSYGLPFFEHRPNHYQNFDGYYCGCRGWD